VGAGDEEGDEKGYRRGFERDDRQKRRREESDEKKDRRATGRDRMLEKGREVKSGDRKSQSVVLSRPREIVLSLVWLGRGRL
jgi:hypothetical protein